MKMTREYQIFTEQSQRDAATTVTTEKDPLRSKATTDSKLQRNTATRCKVFAFLL